MDTDMTIIDSDTFAQSSSVRPKPQARETVAINHILEAEHFILVKVGNSGFPRAF